MSPRPLRSLLAAMAVLAGTLEAAPLAPPALRDKAGDRQPDRVFAHGDDIVYTWGRWVQVLDAETLEILFEDDSHSDDIVALPVGSREQFFYFRFEPKRELVGLRGLATTLISQSADYLAAAAPGGRLLFTTRGGPGAGSQGVYTTDGSTGGTRLLFSLAPGYPCPLPPACEPVPGYPRFLEANAAGRVYYQGYFTNPFSASSYLYTLDPPLPGGPAPEVREVDFLGAATRSRQMMPDGRLVFTLADASYPYLYVAAGGDYRHIFEFSQLGANGAYGLTEMDGRIYFLAESAGARALWSSDGTEAGTRIVRGFGPGPAIAALYKNGDHLYLPVDAEGRGEELWVSDGSEAGTRLAFEIGPGPSGARPRSLTPLDDGRFLIALDDGVHGPEPWISDGTPAGTALFVDARPGPLGTSPEDMVLAGGRLFFVGDSERGRVAQQVPAPPAAATCPADRLCLHGGRFEVETFFTTPDATGQGQRSVASDQTGIFSFFSPDNWEVMVKVLDGCTINDRFWVFASAATDVRYELRVTDKETGVVRRYQHGGGGPAPAITDIDAFGTCN